MLFKNVSIAGLAHIDAPATLTSQEINLRLKPTLHRLGIRKDILGDIAGIQARRLWDGPVQASEVATLASKRALSDAKISIDQIGLVVNTSVSRDFLEPSTASIICGNLGTSASCQSFDVGNACLAFLNGMDIAARMLECAEIDYALVVDGETANLIYEKTLERLSADDISETDFRAELASLTLGCGAAAMVLSRRELAPHAPRYRGGVACSATHLNGLCRGNSDRMMTDTRVLLHEGIKLAQKTFTVAKQVLGWAVDELDQFVIHQVSKPHTAAFIKSFRIDPAKVMTIFSEYGNIGPASVPIVLSKLKELGKLKTGDRIALFGIGSGLNCAMAEVVW